MRLPCLEVLDVSHNPDIGDFMMAAMVKAMMHGCPNLRQFVLYFTGAKLMTKITLVRAQEERVWPYLEEICLHHPVLRGDDD